MSDGFSNLQTAAIACLMHNKNSHTTKILKCHSHWLQPRRSPRPAHFRLQKLYCPNSPTSAFFAELQHILCRNYTMELRIAAIALVGLIVSVSGGTATPSDDASTTRPTRTIASYHRRLEDTCPSSASPYNSATPITDSIGMGSPGPGNCISAPDKLRMLAPGGKTRRQASRHAMSASSKLVLKISSPALPVPRRVVEFTHTLSPSQTVLQNPSPMVSDVTTDD